MYRKIPIKQILIIAVLATMMIAAIGAMNQPITSNNRDQAVPLSPEDKAWLRERLGRGPMPAPKPDQPRVLLIWRSRMDGPKVRPVVNLVDHPEGVDGVYGVDVADSDPLATQLHVTEIKGSLPSDGAWLVVLDGFGRLLGYTPILNPSTIQMAFDMAHGKKVSFPGSDDPYINKPAPGFNTRTLDGKPVSLSSFKGKKVVLNFYCGCESCTAMAKELARVQKTPPYQGVEFLALTHMTPYRSEQFSKGTGQTYTALVENGIDRVYNSTRCPRVWYIAPDGTIKYYSHQGEEPNGVVPALTHVLQAS